MIGWEVAPVSMWATCLHGPAHVIWSVYSVNMEGIFFSLDSWCIMHFFVYTITLSFAFLLSVDVRQLLLSNWNCRNAGENYYYNHLMLFVDVLENLGWSFPFYLLSIGDFVTSTLSSTQSYPSCFFCEGASCNYNGTIFLFVGEILGSLGF